MGIEEIFIILFVIVIAIVAIYKWLTRKAPPEDTEKDNMMFIRPKNCRYCTHGYNGLFHAVTHADDKKVWDIIDIQRTEAVKAKVFEYIDTYNPYSLYGVGHGSPTIYTGDTEKPIFTTTDCSNLSGRIVYLLSCLTANLLGPAIIANGAKSYAGFNISWTWLAAGGVIGDPYNDKYAKGFYESANELWITLCNGETFGVALQASVNKYNYWIDHWYNSSDPNKNELMKWLIHDRDGLVGLGDMSSTL